MLASVEITGPQWPVDPGEIETRELTDAELERVAGGVAHAYHLIVELEPDRD